MGRGTIINTAVGGAAPLSNNENFASFLADQATSAAGGTPIPNKQTAPNPLASQPTPVPDNPGVPGQNEGSSDMGDMAQSIDQYNEDSRPKFTGPTQSAEVMPQGENYLGYGKDRFEDADKNFPAGVAQSIDVGANAEAAKADAVGNWYGQEKQRQSEELALMNQRHIERQAELTQKMKEVTDASTRWSNDLADSGKYWRNPGNIISAIALNFMTLGTKDPRIALNAISGAVAQDYKQRKDAADTELGALQSNVTAFRQIAGDKDLGDRLAFADANRIAAMEVMRIGQQFEGPIAKAKASALSNELMRKWSIEMGMIHNQVINTPVQAQQKPIADAIKAGGRNNPGAGYAPYGQPDYYAPGGKGGTPALKTTGAGVPGRGQSSAGPSASTGGDSAVGAQVNSAMRAASGGPTRLDKLADRAYDKRMPGTSRLIPMFKNQIAEKALRELGPNVNKYTFDKKVQEIMDDDEKQAGEMAKAAAPNLAEAKGWQAFNSDVQKIKAAAKMVGKTPDELIQNGFKQFAPDSADNKINEITQRYGSRDTDEAKQKMAELDAAIRFQQHLAGKIVSYKKENIGGAQSEQELEGISQVIKNSDNWAKIENFANMQSRNAYAKTFQSAAAQGNPRAAYRMMINYGMNSPGLNTSPIPKTTLKTNSPSQ